VAAGEEAFLEILRGTNGVHPKGLDEPTTEVETGTAEEPDAKVAAPGGVTSSNLLRHPDAHPIALDLLLLRQYGPQWMLWEGETLQHIAPADFHGQVLSDLNLAKLQACRTLHLVDTYWQRWEVFGWCTIAMNGEFPDFDLLQVPTVAQVLVSVDAATRIREDVPFSDEIKGYIGSVYRHDDIFLALPPADFVTFDPQELPFDVGQLKSRWPDVRASRQAPTGETLVDEELRRLLVALDYLEASRTRLGDQLRLLEHV
jgi:hypothetical protein